MSRKHVVIGIPCLECHGNLREKKKVKERGLVIRKNEHDIEREEESQIKWLGDKHVMKTSFVAIK